MQKNLPIQKTLAHKKYSIPPGNKVFSRDTWINPLQREAGIRGASIFTSN